MYFDWLQNIATNIFEWENLPVTIPERHLNIHFLPEDSPFFFEDPEKGYYALPATGKGEKNVYGEDISWYVNSYGYSKMFVPGPAFRSGIITQVTHSTDHPGLRRKACQM